MLHTIALAFGASFIFIFLKAFQQRNVIHDNFGWVFPTSIGMALTEYGVIALIAARGYNVPLVLAAGCGAGTGAMLAMVIHKRLGLATKKESIPTTT